MGKTDSAAELLQEVHSQVPRVRSLDHDLWVLAGGEQVVPDVGLGSGLHHLRSHSCESWFCSGCWNPQSFSPLRTSLVGTLPFPGHRPDSPRARRRPGRSVPGLSRESGQALLHHIKTRGLGTSRAPAGLLHEGHGHRATLGQRQDRPAPRLPRSDLAPLFCAPICCRAIGRPDEGPRHHRRGQGLVPGDGAHPHDLVPCSLFLACALVVRNLAVADAFVARQEEDRRREAAGLAPRSRRRRRTTLAALVGAANAPP